jgi:hypothetical protein
MLEPAVLNKPELQIIDVFICKLRRKLANAANGKNTIEAAATCCASRTRKSRGFRRKPLPSLPARAGNP